jgi:hypothetical protein
MGGYARRVHVVQLIGLTIVYTSTTLVDGFVLGVVLGSLGYFLSERYKRARGVTPWRVPSGMWAVLLFLLSLIGVVMYLIACFTTRPKTGPTGWAGGDQHWSPGPRDSEGRPREGWNSPPQGQWGQGAPQGWDAPVPGPWEAPPPGYSGAPPPGGWDPAPPPGTVFPGLGTPGAPGAAAGSAPPVPPPPAPPRSWLPDPGGRHELRYWDGTRFTEHVSDGGKISTDPL